MQEKNKCRLCQINDADQTGSHILSALSVKSMIGNRGEETAFLISPDPLENYRKNVQADEIKEDYILCRGCEQRLSYVEGYIATELNNKIKESNFKTNFPVKKTGSIDYIECLRVNPHAFQIFLYSLIWRASISKNRMFFDFTLDQDLEEKLRDIINTILPPRTDYRGVTMDFKTWAEELEKNKAIFTNIKFLLFSTSAIDDTTGDFVIFHPNYNNPYGMMLNEWIIYFDVKENSNQDLFDLLHNHNTVELINFDSNKIKIIQLENEKWNGIRRKLINILKEQKIKNMRVHFTIDFLKKHGYMPSQQILDNLILDFIQKLDWGK